MPHRTRRVIPYTASKRFLNSHMTLSDWLFFVAASAAIIIVPGPTVSIIIANSLRDGARAGLWIVAGTQLGLVLLIVLLALGFSFIVENALLVFNLLRWLGAAYLVYLGVRLWISSMARAKQTQGHPYTDVNQISPTPLNEVTGRRQLLGPTQFHSSFHYLWQGFVVICSNPKALFFFGAFIPQFIDPGANTGLQILLLGGTFMLVGALFDGAYALAAGSAGSWLGNTSMIWLERLSGTFLIAGAVWLGFSEQTVTGQS